MTDRLKASLAPRHGEPAWLTQRRNEAYARFESLSWPDQSYEEWRHTDVRDLDVDAYEPMTELGEISASSEAVISTITDVARDEEERLRAWIGSAGVSEHEAKFAALNAALGDGFFVYVPRGVQIVEPITARWRLSGTGTAVFPRTIIVAEEGSQVTYIDRYEPGSIDGEALSVANVEIYAGAGSNVNYLSVQDWPQTVKHFSYQRAVVGRDATVRTLAASFGAKLSRTVVEAILDGKGSHAEMLGVYFGDSAQHIDNRTLQLHRGHNTSSDLYYKGALKGSSRAIYSGLVDIEKDALMADAQQANRNLLLSPHASADPNPFLEIKTSEVARATHGVSVGRPDDDVLFYLRSRGIPDAEAESLLVKGFFQEVIDRVRVPEIREALEAAVERELMLEDA